MIFYFLFLVITFPISLIFAIFPNWEIIPDGVFDSIYYFLNIAYSWNVIFPIDTLFLIFGLFLTIETALYLFGLVITFLRWFRIIA